MKKIFVMGIVLIAILGMVSSLPFTQILQILIISLGIYIPIQMTKDTLHHLLKRKKQEVKPQPEKTNFEEQTKKERIIDSKTISKDLLRNDPEKQKILVKKRKPY